MEKKYKLLMLAFGFLLMWGLVNAVTTITQNYIESPALNTTDWKNVTITESQISNLQDYLTVLDYSGIDGYFNLSANLNITTFGSISGGGHIITNGFRLMTS